MDAVKELELSLKEIAKWDAFEARRIASLVRRESRAKLASDMKWIQRKEKKRTELPQRLAIIKAKQERLKAERKEKRLAKLPEKVAKYQTQREVSNLKRRLSRVACRLAAIPIDFKCPKCGHKKLKNRMWVIVDGVAICKGCHLGWKEPKPIDEEVVVDAKAALRVAVPKDYVCNSCGKVKIALKYWCIDSNGVAVCKKCSQDGCNT